MISIFILGSVVFLFAFTFFKIAAFKKVNPEQSWKKLFAVSLIDYLILILEHLGQEFYLIPFIQFLITKHQITQDELGTTSQ